MVELFTVSWYTGSTTNLRGKTMFKKIITAFIYAIILILCGMIILRCCANSDRTTMTELLVTSELTEAYRDGEMEVLKLEENASEIAPDGYFTAYGFRYIPEARQLQVTVRYNVSNWEYLELPEGTEFSFFLCKNEDETTLREPDVIVKEAKSIYRYAKLVWNNVDIGEDNWQIFMDRQDGQYSIAPLRYVEQEYRPYKLTGAEKKALAG